MSSPITMSSFNGIDFNSILNLTMQQEQVPRDNLATQQSALKDKNTAFATLATKVSALQSAADDLTTASTIAGRVATSSDATTVEASSSTSAVAGSFDITVTKLASVQVTAATTQQADSDQTIVANGGTLTIGSTTVDLTDKSVTLQGLADAINGTTGIGVTATVISPDTGKYELVLTGNESGAANGFTITNNMTLDDEDSLIAFGGNAQTASDAQLTVNGISIKSASNSVSGAIPGTTLDLHQKTAAGASVTVTISKSSSTAQTNVQKFVDTYNDLVTFIQAQGTDINSLGRDPLLRSMWSQLRNTINTQYTVAGSKSSLAAIGVGFDTTGRLTLNSATLSDAMDSSESAVLNLFAGSGSMAGAFSTISSLLDRYVGSGGLIGANEDRLTAQIASMDNQLANMDARLAQERASLQQEYTATDTLMTQLNSQSSTISNLGSGYQLY